MAWLLTLAPHCSFFVSSTSVWDSLTEAIPLRYNELKGVRQTEAATHIVMESTTGSLFFYYYLESVMRSFFGENSLKIPSSWLFSAFYSTKFFATVWNFSTTFHNRFFISRAEGLMCICIFSSTEIPLKIVWFPQTKRKKGDATMLQHFKGMLCFSSIETHSGCFHRHRAIASKK